MLGSLSIAVFEKEGKAKHSFSHDSRQLVIYELQFKSVEKCFRVREDLMHFHENDFDFILPL